VCLHQLFVSCCWWWRLLLVVAAMTMGTFDIIGASVRVFFFFNFCIVWYRVKDYTLVFWWKPISHNSPPCSCNILPHPEMCALDTICTEENEQKFKGTIALIMSMILIVRLISKYNCKFRVLPSLYTHSQRHYICSSRS
jgi:hypothetical protein